MVKHAAVESISEESMQSILFVIGGLTHVSSLLHEIKNKQIATLKKSNLIILNMVCNFKIIDGSILFQSL
jgi:hypothetical protein